MLAALRAAGAMLPHVRPEALMAKDDFLRVRKYSPRGMFGPPFGGPVLEYASPAQKARTAKRLSLAFPALSLEAWTSVVLQARRRRGALVVCGGGKTASQLYPPPLRPGRQGLPDVPCDAQEPRSNPRHAVAGATGGS